MSKIKHFQINIESVIGVNVDGLNFAATLIQIKQKYGKVLKISPLNLLSQSILHIQGVDKIILIFSLLETSALGSRDPRVFAEGTISINCKQIQSNQKLNIGCTIRNIIDKKALLTLVIRIKQDQQRLAYQMPDSQPSYVSQLPSQQKVESSPLPSQSEQSEDEQVQIISTPRKQIKQQVKKPQQEKKKSISSFKRSPKKPLRARHYQYSIKNSSSNMELTNKVTDQYRIFIENLRFQIDDPISSIQFHGKTYPQLLAQVFFKTNPTQEQLKNLRIKVPEDEKQVKIHLKTLEGHKYSATTYLPQLDQNQCLKIECEFKDEKDEVKGNMKFNYKQVVDDLGTKQEKMQLAEQISLFERKKKFKDQCNFIPYLFAVQKQKPPTVQSQKLKLPKIFQKESNIVSQTFNQKIIPNKIEVFSTLNSSLRKDDSKLRIERERKTQKRNMKQSEHQMNKNTEPFQVFSNYQTLPNRTSHKRDLSYSKKRQSEIEVLPIKKTSRDSFIKNNTQFNVFSARPQNYSEEQIPYQKEGNSKNRKRVSTQPMISFQNNKSIIKIKAVSVKFYKQYLEQNSNLSKNAGKFLQIYSNYKNIYRSEPVFTQKILSWSFNRCQIEMNQYENINFQLNIQKENTLLGQLIISYNQMKYNEQENSLYFGYLTKNNEMIGKIHIEYDIHSNQVNKHRMTTLQVTEPKRGRRLYSQDLALNQTEFSYKKQSPNKFNMYESSVPSIPEEPYKSNKKRLCHKQRQMEVIKERKRNKIFSLPKQSKYY